jgi:hypothetical protein
VDVERSDGVPVEAGDEDDQGIGPLRRGGRAPSVHVRKLDVEENDDPERAGIASVACSPLEAFADDIRVAPFFLEGSRPRASGVFVVHDQDAHGTFAILENGPRARLVTRIANGAAALFRCNSKCLRKEGFPAWHGD